MTAIQQTLKELAAGRDLSAELMRSTMQDLMAGRTDPVQVGGFLMALRVKGETPVELAAAAQVMREVARRVEVDRDGLTDIVGTGGDGASLFNVSTASAFAPPPPACAWPSTVAARCPAAPARPTCWKRPAAASTWRPRRWPFSLASLAWASCLRRSITWP